MTYLCYFWLFEQILYDVNGLVTFLHRKYHQKVVDLLLLLFSFDFIVDHKELLMVDHNEVLMVDRSKGYIQ